MTLEDFFTLAEIKDGLTLTSRVQELLSVMQANKDSVLKNGGDASRQWTAVASTIAATKNRDCLDVFVNLDGLLYLSSWLAEARNLAIYPIDRTIEESILALLEALENLGLDSSRLVSSGIWVSVKELAHQDSSRVQDQARKLFVSWKDKEVYEQSERDTESCTKIYEYETKVGTAGKESSRIKPAVTLCSIQSNNEKLCPEKADEALLSGRSQENNSDQDKSLELQNDKVGFESNVNSHCLNTMAETLNGSSTVDIMKEVQENLSVKEKSSMNETVGPTIFVSTPTDFSSLLNSDHNRVEGPSNTPVGAEISKEKQLGVCENLGGAAAVTSSSAGHVAGSSDSIVASVELENKCLLQSGLDSNEGSIAHDSKHVPSLTHIKDDQDSEKSSGLQGDHGRNKKGESDNMIDSEEKKDDKSHSNRKKRVKRKKTRTSSRSMTISQRLGAIDKTTADIDLGILDALEVATKVAQEVAREVDSGEPSRSSSEELSDESSQSDASDDDLPTGSPSKGLLLGESHSSEEPQVGDNDVMDEKSNKMNSDSDGAEEKQLATAAKTEVGRGKSPCGFDLNEDICLDETDVIMSSKSTTTTPIMSVSNSGMPSSVRLHMEGSLSEKGTAANSVFHPILPHKVPSGDLREKQVICGIDLNEAGEEDDDVPWKPFPFPSSNYRSGESSNEANLRGSGGFNLDLNCTNEEDDTPPVSLKMETRLFLSHNVQQNATPDSSLSVSQQSGKEVNFDLNDSPQIYIDSHDQDPYYVQHPWSTGPYGGHKMDAPVISFLGGKVDVDRKDSVSQMHSFLSNGKSIEPEAGLYMGRTENSLGLAPGVSFSTAPMYGYNGLTGPPGMYMVDSRGAPVMMPQIMGSNPYMQQPAFPQQHMLMSLNGAAGPNFEQSSWFGVEMGNREAIGLRQFLSPEQSGGEHSGANEPSSSSSIRIGGKRKEPETLREFPPWR